MEPVFALLVYGSSWLKRHEPASFLAALLNAQPLKFYSPSQLVQDARRHGIEVRAADVMHSDSDCTLENEGMDAGSTAKPASVNEIFTHPLAPDQPAVRLGLRLISSLSEAVAARIVQARGESPLISTADLTIRAQLEQGDLKALAGADVLAALSGHRRQQVREASALKPAPGLLKAVPVNEDWLELPAATEGAEVVFDYASIGLTLRSHPLALSRTLTTEKAVQRALADKGLAQSRIQILDALLKPRQVCCEPRLVPLAAAKKIKQSAKLERLMEMLPEMLAKGRRVLLFSRFTGMLALIEQEPARRDIAWVMLTGQS